MDSSIGHGQARGNPRVAPTRRATFAPTGQRGTLTSRSKGSLGALGRGELALGGVEHACTLLVGSLVRGDLAGAFLVSPIEHGADLAGVELVVPGQRLAPAQACDPAQDRVAVLMTALVGVDLREVDHREAVELLDDFRRRESAVSGDRQVALFGDGTLELALGAGDVGNPARLAGAAACAGRRASRFRSGFTRRRPGGVRGPRDGELI